MALQKHAKTSAAGLMWYLLAPPLLPLRLLRLLALLLPSLPRLHPSLRLRAADTCAVESGWSMQPAECHTRWCATQLPTRPAEPCKQASSHSCSATGCRGSPLRPKASRSTRLLIAAGGRGVGQGKGEAGTG